MAKKTSKKIDQVLAELAELRREVRALAKARAPAEKKRAKAPVRKASGKPSAAAEKRKAASSPKRPVLVAGSDLRR